MNATWHDAGFNSEDTQVINTVRTLAITEDTPEWYVCEIHDSAGNFVDRVYQKLDSLPKLMIDVFWFVDTSGSMRGTPSANVNASFDAMTTQLAALGADTSIQRYNNGSAKENVFRDFRGYINTVKQLRRPGSMCHIIGASDTGVWTSNINDTPDLIRQLREDGPCDLWMYAVAGGERGDAIGGSRGYDSAFNALYGNTNNMLRDTSSIVSGIVDRVEPLEVEQPFPNIPDLDTYTVTSYMSSKNDGTGTKVQQETTTVTVADRTGPEFNITVTQTLYLNGRNRGKTPVVTTLDV